MTSSLIVHTLRLLFAERLHKIRKKYFLVWSDGENRMSHDALASGISGISGRILWGVLTLLGFLSVPLGPIGLEAAQGGKTEVLPVQKAAPVAVVIETTGSETELRRQMREKTRVTELHSGTIRFSEAPTGSFGFISPQALGMVLVMQSPDLVLERVSTVPNAYEIHKLADGNGLLVGFIEKTMASLIAPKERPAALRIALYSNSTEEAPLIAAVPLVKLMVDQMPRRRDPSKRDGPVVLEMDLQSTMTRKGPISQ